MPKIIEHQEISRPWQKVYKKSHFAPAFLFLSPERRHALEALYAICRVLDDAVDAPKEDPVPFLEDWKKVFEKKDPNPVVKYEHGLLAEDFLKFADKFGIPLFAMVDLIEKGVAVDLEKNRFETPLDTESYCYGVAGTVGLACLPIFGVPYEEGKDYAIRLGITVQWINTIRDVGVDAKMGRIYLPLDHLEQFGYTEQELLAGAKTPQFQQLMEYEAGVAKSHFKRASELMPEKWKKTLLPARIMGRIYMDLLDKIERKKFPIFDKKVKLNLVEKMMTTYKEIRN